MYVYMVYTYIAMQYVYHIVEWNVYVSKIPTKLVQLVI
jgi:hypothetical protein